jgi:hypothetical protein
MKRRGEIAKPRNCGGYRRLPAPRQTLKYQKYLNIRLNSMGNDYGIILPY